MIKITCAATVAALLAGSAMAVTTVTSANGPDVIPAGQTVIFSFDSAPTGGFLTGTGSIVNGSSSGVYAAPYLDTTDYLTVGADLTETFHLDTETKTLSLYWGSIDAYNQIAFFRADGSLITGYYGNQIPLAPADGSQGNPVNNRRVSFDFGSDRAKFVTINSSANAFELDNVAVGAIPEPMAWSMLVTGFALIGAAARRRRPAVVAA